MKKSTKKKQSKALAVFSIILAILFITAAGVGAWGWVRAVNAERQLNKPNDAVTEIIAYTGEGEPIYTGSNYVLPKSMIYTARTSPEYVNGGEITVTATSSNPYIKGKYDWTVRFAYETDDWAVGKTATDYLSVTPTSDGSDTATIKYLEKFGATLLVEARLRGSTGKTDSCTIECLRNAVISNFYWGGSDFGDYVQPGAALTFETGTVEGDFTLNSLSISMNDSFLNKVKNYLKFELSFLDYTFPLQLSFDIIENDRGYFLSITSDIVTLDWSMLIKDFNNYDQQHKDAIYFAWYRAFRDSYFGVGNALLTYTLEYNYGAIVASRIVESDLTGAYVTGSLNGSEVNPDAVLNGNYVV